MFWSVMEAVCQDSLPKSLFRESSQKFFKPKTIYIDASHNKM